MSDLKSKWVILELSHQGEKRTPDELYQLLSNEIGEVEVFIPSVTFSRRESAVTICLMEGYFFIAAVLPPASFFTLEELPYIKRVLTNDEPNGRYINYVEPEVIEDLRSQLQDRATRDILVDDYVVVVEGAYSGLRGKILQVFSEDDKALIHIVDLKSMEVIVELPFQFFEHAPQDDEDYAL